ncbi:MAG: sulfotransferase [Deltaproteobacteria bacterium]|nr:sulfotransferase [Deltaproteobacteria bacterium]
MSAETDPIAQRLVFLIGPPRSGSTLLSRMLGAHSAIVAPEEPHLITPLAHLGYYASVEAAPYDPIITQKAARALVADLPGGEQTYLTALRGYSDAIYSGLLAARPAVASGGWLLDKTPAYALSLDFLVRLYPTARYVVLTRHPLAIWSSYVDSFFDGDDRIAHAHNPLLERYVPAIARFLREPPGAIHRVRYEALVRDPEGHARALADFLGLAYEPAMVDYGSAAEGTRESTRGLGDPMTVARETRATTKSLAKWAEAATGRPERVGLYREIVARLFDEDLETWGHPRAEIEAELDRIDLAGRPAPRPALTRYSLERKLLVALRRRIRPENRLGRWVRKLREVCDVLLR